MEFADLRNLLQGPVAIIYQDANEDFITYFEGEAEDIPDSVELEFGAQVLSVELGTNRVNIYVEFIEGYQENDFDEDEYDEDDEYDDDYEDIDNLPLEEQFDILMDDYE